MTVIFALMPNTAIADGPQLNVVEVATSRYPSVTITVEALGGDGLPITDLDQQDFRVYENGHQQNIDSSSALETSHTPLNVMLVLDTSLSMADGGKLEQAKQAAMSFVSQMRPIDRVGLIQFDSQLTLVSPFTGNSGALLQQIDDLTPQGNTRIYDALYLATQQIPTVDGSKAIVLLTDGKDTESAIDLQRVLSLVGQTNVRVYTIGIGSDIDQQILSQIATESGGRFFDAPAPADIGYAFQLMSDQLRNRYEITYHPTTPSARGTKIELQLTAQTARGLASTMTSYIAPAILSPGVTGTASLQQPQIASPAAMSSRTAYVVSALVGLGVLLGAAGLALLQVQRTRHARMAFFVGGKGEEPAEAGQSLLSEVMIGMSRVVAGSIARLLAPSKVQKISRQLILAGNPRGWRVSQFVAAKFFAGAVGLAAGLLILTHGGYSVRGLVLMILIGFFGYRLPTFWLKRRVKQRQSAILRSLPDALDLLTICVEAGLGMDGAILEVVDRWDNALSDEFSIVLAELKMGRGRRDALRSLADRTGLQEVTSFTSALIQADELGMGIARPLALQAQQLRIKRKQRAEKLAHEAGIKMVVAMGLFIMPAMFMIILSPAVVQIHGLFGGH